MRKLEVFASKEVLILRLNILSPIDRVKQKKLQLIKLQNMGSATQPLKIIPPPKKEIPKVKQAVLLSYPTGKAYLKKINPIVLDDDSIMMDEEDEDIVRLTSKLNEQQYALLQNEMNQLERQGEQIKVKWNDFIKMKNKNYLDDYEILSELGRGGYGKVNKVRSKYTGIMRAAKKIKKSSLDKDQYEKLFAEMLIMQSLDHNNITKLFEVYDYKSHLVLILELCEGGELFKKIIVSDGFKEAQVGSIVKQILKVLLYLKHKKIVHRDLKPENILFQKNSKLIKIIDFGIATQKIDGENLTQRIGTPYYVAPEVLLKNYDEKCDIWSTGIIMYMMMMKRPPFKGNNEHEVMTGILTAEPVFPKQMLDRYSQECIDFLKSMLIKNPFERIDVDSAFNHPWLQSQNDTIASIQNQRNVIEQIGHFKFKNKLEAVVYTFIVSQLMTTEQKTVFSKIFQELDKNNDGVISKAEFNEALSKKLTIPKDRMSLLMRIIDTNSSGYIDLTEFIVAGLKIKEFFTKEHFEQAFAYFDIDHSGEISFDEIAFFLGDKEQSQESIKKIFQEVDQNNDGVISREQFVLLLMNNNHKRYLQNYGRR